ncbi:MAG: hypothetical protein MZW92_52325 [Comamonadaceae bacterium]|nr:hypothetical protein [Comamonadaceae bacterium]
MYGRILGVPVHAVRDAADLRQTLAELRDKHMVLIDTVGMSQRDRQVAEQTAMLLDAGDVRRLLLLNATAPRRHARRRGARLQRRRIWRGVHPDQGRRGGDARRRRSTSLIRQRAGALLRRQRPARAGGPAPAEPQLPAAPCARRERRGSPFRLDGDEAGLIAAAAAGGRRRAHAGSRRV